MLLVLDVLAALWVSGRLGGLAKTATVLLILMLPHDARAQNTADLKAFEALRGVVLAHVLTGNAEVDRIAAAGLAGLGERLRERTSIEPEVPMGVDIETDELLFYPFLYWPITPDQTLPSTSAYAKLNRFLRTGGMILFDTRDGDLAGLGGTTPEGQMLQLLAAGLDIPADSAGPCSDPQLLSVAGFSGPLCRWYDLGRSIRPRSGTDRRYAVSQSQ